MTTATMTTTATTAMTTIDACPRIAARGPSAARPERRYPGTSVLVRGDVWPAGMGAPGSGPDGGFRPVPGGISKSGASPR